MAQAGSSSPSAAEPSSSSEVNDDVKQPITEIVLARLDKSMTRKATNFSLLSWDAWRRQREEMDPHGTLEHIEDYHTVCGYTEGKIDKLLSMFVTEIKCRDGQEYLEDSVKGLMFGLQRYLKCYGEHYNIPQVVFMKNSYLFPQFTIAMKKRLESCRGKQKAAPAKGITRVQEESLWDKGTFGIDTAQALSDTTYFYTVKIFGITSSSSLRYLKPEDFSFSCDQYGEYVELDKNFCINETNEPLSNYNHALEIPNSSKLRHYCNPSNPRTFYNLLSFYMELIKLVPRGDSYGFFLAPKYGMQFRSVAIGRNMLQKKFGAIMRAAGIYGNFTNQALVQSFHPVLLQNGYRVKKAQLFTLEEHMDICRILDPPPGVINTAQLEVAISQHLCQVDQETGAITQRGFTQNEDVPTPASNFNSGIPLSNSLQKIIQGNMHQQQPKPTTPATSQPQKVTLIPVIIRPPGPQQIQTQQKLQPQQQQASTQALQQLQTHALQQLFKQKPLTVQAPNTPSITSVASHTPVTSLTSTSQYDGSTDEEMEDIEKIINIAVKQEPIDYEFDVPEEAESILASVREAGLESTEHVPNKDNDDRHKRKRETTEINSSPTKKQKQDQQMAQHTAVIEYSVTSDPVKNIYKQEISVSDNDQNTFSFTGTNKMGKTASDLDINLGDYLPDNAVIKPEDIDLKRIILADGGKLKFKVKYSVPT